MWKWKLKIKIQKGERGDLSPEEAHMTILEIIEGIGELAQRSNMTFEEAVEWISKNNRDENILPWEDEENEHNNGNAD